MHPCTCKWLYSRVVHIALAVDCIATFALDHCFVVILIVRTIVTLLEKNCLLHWLTSYCWKLWRVYYKHKKSKLRFSSFVQGSQIRQIWRILLQNCSDDSTEVAEGVDMNVHWHYRSWISGGWCLQSGCFFARNIACTWIAVLRLAIASQFDISPFAFCEKWLCT